MSLHQGDEEDRAWADRLRDLPRSIEPETDLWPGVLASLSARSRARRVRRLAWGAGTALSLAAAVTLVVGYVRHEGARHEAMAVHETTYEQRAGAEATADPEGEEGFLPEEPAYRAALVELRGELSAHEEQMDPSAREAVHAELEALDDAIVEARAALSAHPQDPELRERLRDEYQQEIDVLGDVIDLSTRT